MTRIVLVLAVTALALQARAGEPTQSTVDKRFAKPKDFDGYFPWTPPDTKEVWETRRVMLREQVLVANGLWPMPEKIPLKPTIHDTIDRDGYTIQKVFFASLPGHYVSGNLYRPKGRGDQKLPAVLCPHGHWSDGRLYEAGEKEIARQIKLGGEKTHEGAKYPLQARCAQLARMGCVVFFYDMVGYADSLQLTHRKGFLDVEAELRLQSFMGLQTFNSIRALDFLLSLPEVDPGRIGVTGASGGGTQTFILGAIDDRPAAAFPAVMVSTSMQGGCICENCSYLRVGTGNIELAALFAPRPLAMSGAEDWTREIESKGLPELKFVYKLYDAEDKVMAKAFRKFDHNYNQVSREIMYNFFNTHLRLGHKTPVTEQPFIAVSSRELRVFDNQHSRPKDAVNAGGVREWMTEQSDKHLMALLPKDKATLDGFQKMERTALRVMIGSEMESAGELEPTTLKRNGFIEGFLKRNGSGEKIPFRLIAPDKPGPKGELVVWVHPKGCDSLGAAGQLDPAAQKFLASGATVLAVEVCRTGSTADKEKFPINKDFAGFTFGYNRTLAAERVRDILSAVAYGGKLPGVKSVHLAGFEEAGPWVILARALAGDKVGRTVADLNQFDFSNIKSMDDEMMMPGALRYGGLLTFAGLCAPHELYLHNSKGTGSPQFLEAAYEAAGQAKRLRIVTGKVEPSDAAAWLVR